MNMTGGERRASVRAGLLIVTLSVLLTAATLRGAPEVPVQNAGPSASPASTTPSSAGPTNDVPEVTVPVTTSQLDRIRKALDEPPGLTLDDDQLRFYVQILAREPNFAEFVKGYDFKNGPTRRGNPMTHQEFLNMVTPRDFYSSGGITATEMLQFAVTNWLGQALVKRAIEEMRNAKSEREIQEIRDRIERELEALRPSAER
jgi:hypothetical protein